MLPASRRQVREWVGEVRVGRPTLPLPRFGVGGIGGVLVALPDRGQQSLRALVRLDHASHVGKALERVRVGRVERRGVNEPPHILDLGRGRAGRRARDELPERASALAGRCDGAAWARGGSLRVSLSFHDRGRGGGDAGAPRALNGGVAHAARESRRRQHSLGVGGRRRSGEPCSTARSSKRPAITVRRPHSTVALRRRERVVRPPLEPAQ
jgi:hypothetical protein